MASKNHVTLSTTILYARPRSTKLAASTITACMHVQHPAQGNLRHSCRNQSRFLVPNALKFCHNSSCMTLWHSFFFTIMCFAPAFITNIVYYLGALAGSLQSSNLSLHHNAAQHVAQRFVLLGSQHSTSRQCSAVDTQRSVLNIQTPSASAAHAAQHLNSIIMWFSGGSPTQALMIFSSIALCLPSAFTTGVPCGTRGALVRYDRSTAIG